MAYRTEAPELNDAIEAYARALAAGDIAAAESFVAPEALPAHRAVLGAYAAGSRFDGFDVLARARIGLQFMSKVRLHGPRGAVTLLNRWKQSADSGWRIAEVDDLTVKRSGWSDIPPYEPKRAENGRA
jgi:hypothetical protein